MMVKTGTWLRYIANSYEGGEENRWGDPSAAVHREMVHEHQATFGVEGEPDRLGLAT